MYLILTTVSSCNFSISQEETFQKRQTELFKRDKVLPQINIAHQILMGMTVGYRKCPRGLKVKTVTSVFLKNFTNLDTHFRKTHSKQTHSNKSTTLKSFHKPRSTNESGRRNNKKPSWNTCQLFLNLVLHCRWANEKQRWLMVEGGDIMAQNWGLQVYDVKLSWFWRGSFDPLGLPSSVLFPPYTQGKTFSRCKLLLPRSLSCFKYWLCQLPQSLFVLCLQTAWNL